eukprot:1229520-Rhodomonas_salina.2
MEELLEDRPNGQWGDEYKVVVGESRASAGIMGRCAVPALTLPRTLHSHLSASEFAHHTYPV